MAWSRGRRMAVTAAAGEEPVTVQSVTVINQPDIYFLNDPE